VTWFLPAASPNASDVDILTPGDITAGRGVVHLTTNFAVDAPLRAQHKQIRASRGENCSLLYSNTSGVDSGLDVAGYEADVAAKGSGAVIPPAAAAAAPAAASGGAGNLNSWGGGTWKLVVVAIAAVLSGALAT
jgi:hypothetical protein